MGCHQPGPLLCSHLINCQLGIRSRTKRNILQPAHSPLYLTMWKHLINFGQRQSGFQTKSKPMTLLWKCGMGTGQWAVEKKLHEQFCQIFDPSNHDKGWGQWRVHLQTTWQIRCLISILTKNTCSQRSYMETKGWDVFRSLPPETDSSSEAVDKWLGTTVKILKVRENLQSD